MPNRITLARWLAVLTALSLIGAACGGGDDTTSGDGASPGDDTADTADVNASADDGDDMSGAAGEMVVSEGMLSGACPSTLVLQTDWWPESEYGAVYNLISDDYEIDSENKMVRGPMTLDGVDLGIEFEIRAGGPSLGSTVAGTMYIDKDIHLGFASTDMQIKHWEDTPVVSVVAPLERNPQMIMWDPETYPDVDSIADLKDLNVPVNVFASAKFPDVLVAQGILSADQIDRGYDGTPARFVTAGGEMAQQGFASSEAYTYEHVHEEWGKPVRFELLHDAGFRIYSQTIGVRPKDIDEMRPCLEKLVPVIQKSVLSFSAAPERTNSMIVDIVDQYESGWIYTADLADYSVQAQQNYHLIDNGSDSTVGNMEAERIQSVIDSVSDIEEFADMPQDLSADDLFTNEFIDPNIGF